MIMTLHAHLEVIREKHHRLDTMIDEELHRPSPDLVVLQIMKKQKLLLKEEMERIRALYVRQIDAA